jgi:hypothetical protein
VVAVAVVAAAKSPFKDYIKKLGAVLKVSFLCAKRTKNQPFQPVLKHALVQHYVDTLGQSHCQNLLRARGFDRSLEGAVESAPTQAKSAFADSDWSINLRRQVLSV